MLSKGGGWSAWEGERAARSGDVVRRVRARAGGCDAGWWGYALVRRVGNFERGRHAALLDPRSYEPMNISIHLRDC